MDEDDSVNISSDDAQAILDWSARAGALLLLMQAAPVPRNAEEVADNHEEFVECVLSMVHTMPDVLKRVSGDMADNAMRSVQEEEEMVQEFRREIDEL